MRFFLLACFASLAGMATFAQTVHPSLPAVKHKTVVIAHRGDHVNFPENTLEAYNSAIKAGVDYIETDLRTTADSGQVIMHHASVDRMTNGKGNVADLTYDKITSLTIPDDAHHKKYHVPSFKEVLLACRGKVNVYLDFKEADVNMTWRMIKALHMEQQVVVYPNTIAQFKEWRKLAPEMPLVANVPDTIKDAPALNAFLDEYPAAAVNGSIGQYTPEMLAVFKNRGVAVWLDVEANDEGPAIWSKALDAGVPGVQTDYPAACTHYLAQQHAR
ncbi:glycerophosphodiester phosphodiesterase family protein [Chitinophaga costaii]|nr:glycerophosphodiester phosphodiesterase family protein [Chitinophaga costaii]